MKISLITGWCLVIFLNLLPQSAFAQSEPQQAEKELSWQYGPLETTLGGQATLKLSKEYRFLGQEDTQRLLKAMGNFPSGTELGLVSPADENKAVWFVVLRFVDAGFVKDEDAENWDADELLAAIREGTEADNEQRKELGIPPIQIRGWEEPPHYDRGKNKVVWAISHQSDQDIMEVNYNTLALGRHGYISMNMVGSLKELPQLKPHAQNLLANLNFIEGRRYADFNSATDKVAAVGLSALIAGAAFKSGLLAKLWAFLLPLLVAGKKVIIVLAVGLVALVAKLFKKPNPTTDTPPAQSS